MKKKNPVKTIFVGSASLENKRDRLRDLFVVLAGATGVDLAVTT
jgi:hypothetical protein